MNWLMTSMFSSFSNEDQWIQILFTGLSHRFLLIIRHQLQCLGARFQLVVFMEDRNFKEAVKIQIRWQDWKSKILLFLGIITVIELPRMKLYWSRDNFFIMVSSPRPCRGIAFSKYFITYTLLIFSRAKEGIP